MKTLIMISMLILMTACNGGGESGGSESTEAPQADLELTFESHSFYVNTGWTSEEFNVDDNRSIIIPEIIERVTDTLNSIAPNDIARIKFVDSNCDYKWNGTEFEFFQCYGALAGAQYGDVIYLSDLTGFGNAALAGKINLGVYRNPASNHTGNIIIKTNLQ